jgi:hypothetical protein
MSKDMVAISQEAEKLAKKSMGAQPIERNL